MWNRPVIAAATGLLLTAGACVSPSAAGVSVDVVAAFYPLQFVAERVGAGHATVTGLAPPGVEAHDLELTPSQVADLDRADLVVYLSDFQPAVDEAVAAHAATSSLDVTTLVPLLDPPAEDDDGPGEDDPGQHDPHVWLDPDRLATIGEGIAAALAAHDPPNADDYAANAAALRAQLSALDTEYAEGLARCERREIVVSHAAFGYLADRYQLRQIAITGLSPEDEPTPQQLAAVIDEARTYGATTIFYEVLVSPEVADVIATEVGADTAVLDPVEGLAPGSDEDYLSLMRTNLGALRTALGCP